MHLAVVVLVVVVRFFPVDFGLSYDGRKIRVNVQHFIGGIESVVFDCCLKANISRPSIQMPTSFSRNG